MRRPSSNKAQQQQHQEHPRTHLGGRSLEAVHRTPYTVQRNYYLRLEPQVE